MNDRRCQRLLMFAPTLCLLAMAEWAMGQDGPAGDDGRGGAVIIIEGNRIVLDGNLAAAQAELLPTPQQLRAVALRAEVRDLVARLDDPEFAKREAAMQSLVDLRMDDVQLFAALETLELSAEQRHRLLHVVRQRLTNAPRGALGIRMDPGRQRIGLPAGELPDPDAPPGVAILEVIPGMPAARVLRAGDRITHISKVPIASTDDLIKLVQTRRPGDTIDLTVQRPEHDEAGKPVEDAQGKLVHQTLNLQITLGTVDDLHDPRIPTAPSRLDIERRRLVAAVEQRYRPQPRAIEVLRP